MYAPESLDLLQKSGINLQQHEELGIEPNDFAELMITSGLVLSDETKWISFHRWVASPIYRARHALSVFIRILTSSSAAVMTSATSSSS